MAGRTDDNVTFSSLRRIIHELKQAQAKQDQQQHVAVRVLSSRIDIITQRMEGLYDHLTDRQNILDGDTRHLVMAVRQLQEHVNRVDTSRTRVGFAAIQEIVQDTLALLEPDLIAGQLEFLRNTAELIETARQGVWDRIGGSNDGQTCQQPQVPSQEAIRTRNCQQDQDPIRSFSHHGVRSCWSVSSNDSIGREASSRLSPTPRVTEMDGLGSSPSVSTQASTLVPPTPPPSLASPGPWLDDSDTSDHVMAKGFGGSTCGHWVAVLPTRVLNKREAGVFDRNI